jgi:hypothetical protein
MTYESSIQVTNSSGKPLLFHLEPWGDQIEMASGATFVLCAKAGEQGSFEVEHGENEIIVWAWPTASVKIFSDGTEIGMAPGVERPAVPDVPEGQTVASFLRLMLGHDRHANDNGEIEQIVGRFLLEIRQS